MTVNLYSVLQLGLEPGIAEVYATTRRDPRTRELAGRICIYRNYVYVSGILSVALLLKSYTANEPASSIWTTYACISGFAFGKSVTKLYVYVIDLLEKLEERARAAGLN